MEAFQAPDGTVISGRAAYREYCKNHNVTNPSDFTNQWEKQRAERDRFYTAKGYDSQRRKEHLKEAYDKLSRRR